MISRPRKAIFILLIACLLFTACSTNTVQPTATVEATSFGDPPTQPAETVQLTETPATVATAAATAHPDVNVSAKGQKVIFWHPWTGDLSKRADEAVQAFNRSNEWGITVEGKSLYSSGALDDAVRQGLKDNGSDLPHVVAATSDQLADWAAHTQAVKDLSIYLASGQYGLSADETQAFDPAYWAQDQVGSVRLGIPALRTAQVIFYNQTWAKELGFNMPPKTPDEFKTQACEAAKTNNIKNAVEKYGTGGWLVDTDALTTLSWLAAFGANPIPSAEGQAYKFESKEGEQAITFLRGMFDAGCAWLGRSPDPHDYFTRRMALFYTGTLADVYAQAHWQEQSKSNDQWAILPFPGQDGKPVVYSSGYSYAVLKTGTPEQQMAGWLFARWLEKPVNAAQLAEALPSLPVSSAIATQLADKKTSFPWTMVLPLAGQARPAPALASWREARRVLEDAAWQIYHLPPEGLDKVLPQTLPQLDEAVQEILKPTP